MLIEELSTTVLFGSKICIILNELSKVGDNGGSEKLKESF